eukprot:gene14972-21028_t
METLDAALEAERREGKARDARHKLTVERLRRQIVELQEFNHELRDEFSWLEEKNHELRDEVRWHEANRLSAEGDEGPVPDSSMTGSQGGPRRGPGTSISAAPGAAATTSRRVPGGAPPPQPSYQGGPGGAAPPQPLYQGGPGGPQPSYKQPGSARSNTSNPTRSTGYSEPPPVGPWEAVGGFGNPVHGEQGGFGAARHKVRGPADKLGYGQDHASTYNTHHHSSYADANHDQLSEDEGSSDDLPSHHDAQTRPPMVSHPIGPAYHAANPRHTAPPQPPMDSGHGAHPQPPLASGNGAPPLLSVASSGPNVPKAQVFGQPPGHPLGQPPGHPLGSWQPRGADNGKHCVEPSYEADTWNGTDAQRKVGSGAPIHVQNSQPRGGTAWPAGPDGQHSQPRAGNAWPAGPDGHAPPVHQGGMPSIQLKAQHPTQGSYAGSAGTWSEHSDSDPYPKGEGSVQTHAHAHAHANSSTRSQDAYTGGPGQTGRPSSGQPGGPSRMQAPADSWSSGATLGTTKPPPASWSSHSSAAMDKPSQSALFQDSTPHPGFGTASVDPYRPSHGQYGQAGPQSDQANFDGHSRQAAPQHHHRGREGQQQQQQQQQPGYPADSKQRQQQHQDQPIPAYNTSMPTQPVPTQTTAYATTAYTNMPTQPVPAYNTGAVHQQHQPPSGYQTTAQSQHQPSPPYPTEVHQQRQPLHQTSAPHQQQHSSTYTDALSQPCSSVPHVQHQHPQLQTQAHHPQASGIQQPPAHHHPTVQAASNTSAPAPDAPGEVPAGEVVREIRHPEGKVERIYASGKRCVDFSNGTRKVTLASGCTSIYFSNLDVKRQHPSGRIDYFYAEVGTWHTTHADGVEVFYFPTGQTEAHHPNGLKEIIFVDGLPRMVHPDGREEDVEHRQLSLAARQPQPSASAD